MSATTIIIDGNFLFYKTLHVAKGYNYPKDKKYLDDEIDRISFIRKITTDFIYGINLFKGFDRVIFTKDSRSWRKTYDEEYKANRSGKKSDDINWDKFFECMDEFCSIISRKGVIVSQIEAAEGDDLMYLWSRYLNGIGENTITITADGDLTQIVQNTDTSFSVVYNSKSAVKKIIVPQRFYEWLQQRGVDNSPLSIWDSAKILNSQMSNDGATIISKAMEKLNYEELNPQEVILFKVICGDDGDNIPSIWKWEKVVNEKKINKRITRKDYIKVLEFLNSRGKDLEVFDLLDENGLDNKIRIILENSGGVKMDLTKFKENLVRNINLVYLHERVIPQSIQDGFKERLKETNLNKKLYAFNKEDILKGTIYEVEPKIKVISDAY